MHFVEAKGLLHGGSGFWDMKNATRRSCWSGRCGPGGSPA